MKKRNSAIDLTDLALGILILGITVTIGANVLIGLRDSRLEDLSVLSTLNETNTSTVTDLSGSEWQLANIWGIEVSYCHNATGLESEIIGTGNYTVNIDAGGNIEVTNLTMESSANSWNCSYNYYDTTDTQWALPNSAAVGIGEYGNWFDIIVIVGVAAVILSLIFMAFGNRGQEQSGVSY